MHRLADYAALAALLAATSGCFYTTSINERPRADIRLVTAGGLYPGQTTFLSAYAVSDLEDGADVECTWAAYSCDDDDCTRRLQESSTIPCDRQYGVTPRSGDHRAILVALTVKDSDGAPFDDTEILQVGNRAPILMGPQANYPGDVDHAAVTVPIRVSVEVDDEDGDASTLTWQLIKPPGGGAGVELAPVDEGGLTQEFTPDVAEAWTVEVTADDSFAGGQTTARVSIPVFEDQPPCIEATLPAADTEHRFVLQREDAPRSFAVTQVADDLDPYPRSSEAPHVGDPSFAWQLASPDTGGELVPVAGVAGAELTIDPSAYAPGDLLDLRVEVSDRTPRDVPCDEADPTCSMNGSTCYQRVSWGVEIR